MDNKEILNIKYEHEYRCIKFCIKKNKNENSDKFIFLSNQENEVFNHLYNNEILKTKDFENQMEKTALRTAICRLRVKVKKLYEIKSINKIGYILVRRNYD